ncbi:hypothetical protein AMQ83_32955, partial [Paenibacillus riograndensis]
MAKGVQYDGIRLRAEVQHTLDWIEQKGIDEEQNIMTNKITTSNLGYPRIGKNREWKKTLEAYWSGKIDEQDFLAQMAGIQLQHLQSQQKAGIDLIPVNDFTFYDHVLDTAVMFGVIPQRYAYNGGAVPLDLYFAMARGNASAPACEMTKWFTTQYHYNVPAIGSHTPQLTTHKPLDAYIVAKTQAGLESKPVMDGLATFLELSDGVPREAKRGVG